MDWQRILKLGFILFLPVANPEFLLHIGKTALYDNTALTWEVFLAEISVKVVKVMCCFNFFFSNEGIIANEKQKYRRTAINN